LDTIEQTNNTGDLDENLPVMNVSNDTLTQSVSSGNRQVRELASHCKEFPQIDYGQLLKDDTIQYQLDNQITYSGSVLFICQYGFMNDINANDSFRITCQNGVFHPKVNCIGKQF
jgi:hypothetical protein